MKSAALAGHSASPTVRIAIIREKGRIGGADLVAAAIKEALEDRAIVASDIRIPASILGGLGPQDLTRPRRRPAVVPRLWSVTRRAILIPHLLRALNAILIFLYVRSLDFRQFDLVIPIQPVAFYVRHPRMLIYFMHHFRYAYDLVPVMMPKGILDRGAYLLHVSVRRLLDRQVLPRLRTAKFIAMSHNVADRLQRFWGIRSTEVIYPGGFIRQSRPLHASYVLYLGTLRNDEVKRVSLIIRTAELLPEVSFLLIGDPNPPPDNYVKLPTNVRLIARNRLLSEDEKADFLGQAICVVYPAYQEDYGLVPVEAMSLGVPCIVCTDGGGVRETVVDGATGLIVEPEPKAIAGAVRSILAWGTSRSERCVAQAQKFTWEAFKHRISSVVIGELQEYLGSNCA